MREGSRRRIKRVLSVEKTKGKPGKKNKLVVWCEKWTEKI